MRMTVEYFSSAIETYSYLGDNVNSVLDATTITKYRTNYSPYQILCDREIQDMIVFPLIIDK